MDTRLLTAVTYPIYIILRIIFFLTLAIRGVFIMPSFVPNIDYREHPAFAGLAYDNPEAATTSALISEANAAYEAGWSEIKSPHAKFPDVFNRQVTGPVRKVFEHILRTTAPCAGFNVFINEVYRRVIRRMEKEYRMAERQGAYVWQPESERSAYFLSELRQKGYFSGHFDPDIVKGLFQSLSPYRHAIEDNLRAGKTSRNDISTNKIDRGTFSNFSQLINHPDIVTAVSNFMGQLTICQGFAFELSVSKAHWWKGRYNGAEYESEAAAYYHLDEGGDHLKMLLYLGDVGRDCGPFSIIPSGWPSKPPPLEFAVARIIDAIGSELHYDDMSHDPEDHQHTFSSPTGRRHFMKLPKEFHFVSHWGNDVVTGSQLERDVIENELRFTSDVANFVVFHGSSLFHRGGIVENPDAQRWGCQVMFNPLPV